MSLDKAVDLAVASWLPDETLFSLASRHHIVSCNCRDSDTCLQLLGHGHVGLRHDLPSRIDFFVEKTHGKFGGADEVIFERTLVPFYFPLNSRGRVEDAICAMRGDRIGSLRYKLGMLAHHFEARHPLKACDLCMKEDVQRLQVAYWHRIHQFPGVWVCPYHRCPLMELPQAGTAIGRFRLCLPKKACLACPASLPSSGEGGRLGFLERIASAALGLAALAPSVSLDHERISRVYLNRLVSTGLRETSGRLRLRDCIASILDAVSPLRSIPEMSALPATTDEARAYVSRLCWKPVLNMHPLQHVFTVVWLFGDWRSFWTAYEREFDEHQSGVVSQYPADAPNQEHHAAYRLELARLMVEEGVGCIKVVNASSKPRRRGSE